MDFSASASSMIDQSSISLRAWPTDDSSKDTLSHIISRINHERGSFRNITEDKLVEEIKATNNERADLDDQSSISHPNDVQDDKIRREEVLAVREEVLKYMELAWNESAHALDFVSAILSRQTPRQAELTMSPFLKQNLPMGSLGAEVMQSPQQSETDKRHDELVSSGWKLRSLSSTADTLLASASRLEEEIKRETIYWAQVLAIKEQGWSLSRLPRENHTLCVRYGFAEAYPDFRDRGLAALRRDDDGNISLDLGNRSLGNQALRIRILQEGIPIASHVRTFEQSVKEMPVVKLLLQARDNIYDEELHHELHREARNYTNQGIRSIDSKVLIPYEVGKEIEIDLVSAVDEFSSVSEDAMCKAIALSLRILLSTAHHQNRRQRSQIPPPIREGKTPRPVYAILRPILENLQHRLQVKLMKNFLNLAAKTLSKANLMLNIEETKTNYHFLNRSTNINNDNLPPTDDLVRALTIPLDSSTIALLPSQVTTLKIEIQTGLQPPFFGTGYRCTTISSIPGSLVAKTPTSMRFSTLEALRDHVLHLVEIDLVSFLESNRHNRDEWKATSLHACRLSRRMSDPGKSQKMNISVRQNQLQLNWQRRSAGFKTEGTEIWDESSMEVKSLAETISGIFADE